MAYAISSDLRIYYEDLGQGEPALLLLPAWCQSHGVYGSLPEKCAAHRRVLAVDWRGTGQSDIPTEDYGAQELVEDALSVIEASGVQQVVPVSFSHGGRVSIELRQRLGDRVPKLVPLDWPIFAPPRQYVDLLRFLASPDLWQRGRDTLFEIWLEGVDTPEVIQYIRGEMGSFDDRMWMRSGREILAGYALQGAPIQALAALEPNIPVLHAYAQPREPEYLAAQQDFAKSHSWFHVYKLEAYSHFPSLEIPNEIATIIEAFVAAEEATIEPRLQALAR